MKFPISVSIYVYIEYSVIICLLYLFEMNLCVLVSTKKG